MEHTKEQSKWLILLVVLISTFMSTLDGSIVNVALPKMAQLLGVTSSKIQFVATSYLIVISATVIIFGRLGDLLGKHKIFQFGIGLFTLGSLLCGITASFPMLILARVIQAAGAAATMANSQGIIAEVFPSKERGKALGLSGTAVALGSLVGPGLGGVIVGALNWEYIFLINVPIGVIALFLSFQLLPKVHEKTQEKMDWFGSLLFMLTVIPLFVSLNEGVSLGFTHPMILSGLLLAVFSFIVFLIVELKGNNPLLELHIFQNKLFSLSVFCGFITFVAIFCNNIILPFYLQTTMSYNPQKTGMILMIYPLLLTLVSPISGHLSDKIGPEILTFIGLLIDSVGLFLMSTLNESSSILNMVFFISLMSIGKGLFQSPNNSLIMSTVPKDKLGIAGSINALARNLGMACGIVLATTLLYNRMSSYLGFLVTDYVEGQNAAFLYGMRIIYLTAGFICILGAFLTFLRLMTRRNREK